MKKTKKIGTAALALKKETIRTLSRSQMTAAAGGAKKGDDNTGCTPTTGPGCSHTLWTVCKYPESLI